MRFVGATFFILALYVLYESVTKLVYRGVRYPYMESWLGPCVSWR